MPGHPYKFTDRELLRRIESSTGQRAGYKQLIRELGLGGGRERRLLLEQLSRMTARGALVKTDREQWALPSATPERTARPSRSAPPSALHPTRERLVAGRIDMHRDGYAFVRPNGSNHREDDLFIPPNEINGAMQGDEVLVDEAPRDREGRRSGRVARVLTRRNPTVVGIFHYARPHRRSPWEEMPLVRGNYVSPFDERMTQPILILEGDEIVAESATAHRVLGEEAQKQRHLWTAAEDSLQPLEGLAVDVEILSFPTAGRPARGRVLEVLGPPDAFGVDVEIVIRKHHLPRIFPANVLAEAADSAKQTVETLSGDELSRRRDFRGLPIVTIDGETARDFDDAVYAQPLANGNWQLQVHIADVSHYVTPGTALDLEARLRGTSVYFPDRAIPMLPNDLSSGMCSLRPDEDRLVQSCLIEIDPSGEVVGFELCEGIIRSVRRMTYHEVQKILDGDAATRLEFSDLVNEFELMHQLALRLNAKRKRRGSLDFDLPEPVVQFDPDGNMQAIVRSERGWSHRLIEEFMLAANECVAHWIESNGIPGIYRVHETPDPKRIVEFEETAAQFGYTLGFSNLPVKKLQTRGDRRDAQRRGREAQTHEIPDAIPVTPQMYQRLTAKIQGKPEERILSYLMLRSLKQARYSEQNVGHFALASPSYTHFTSPIRRYPDLIVHRLLRYLLRSGADPQGFPIPSSEPQPWGAEKPAKKAEHSQRPKDEGLLPQDELNAIAAESSQAERRADDAERELIEWKKIRFMQDRVGEDFSGIILSCTKYGFFVELEELFIEGMVPIASLQDDRYFFRDTDRSIVGARNGRIFKIGLPVQVLLDRIDRQQRRLQFALMPSMYEDTGAPRSLRRSKRAVTNEEKSSPDRSGKPKRKAKTVKRDRKRKAKGKPRR
ncbi:ribonuclease R family protein [Edaphobacter sp. 12200R-103]|uniref:ribonuclease R family protein n=1 Tax=Edaphobacter sp. 12200R-103 TaxID=2703788 RepID=UPI00138B40A3|nr:VacB/RNase II family 3'-5' exoribonuclease [Edaphobacter sp. 12200R-103]QHS53284.1 VacB/RNase II family 3'-5' exoribonuclease [Edaphobacter sp. 12200R-103]